MMETRAATGPGSDLGSDSSRLVWLWGPNSFVKQKLSYLQDQYQQMKIGLAGANATKPDKSLDVVLTELVEDIVVLLQSFKEKVSSFSRHGQKAEEPNKDDEAVLETTGNRRHMLKSQAYSQLGTQANKRHRLVAVGSSSMGTTKTTPSGCGDALHASAVSNSTQRTELIDLANTSSPDDESDEDYVPSSKHSPGKNKMRRQTNQGGQRQVPVEHKLAATAVTKMAELKPANDGLEMTLNSMPLLEVHEPVVERKSPSRRTSGREVLAEQNSGTKEPAGLIQPVRKRGRPKKHPETTYIKEIFAALKNRETHSGQENCRQGNAPPVARSNDHDVGQNKDSTFRTNKIGFKFKHGGKKAEEAVVLEENEAETKTLPGRREGPNTCDLLNNNRGVNVSEFIVYPNRQDNSREKKARYELVYFPAGMTLAPPLSSSSTELKSRTTINSGNLSQAVQQMASKVRQKKHSSGIQISETANVQNRKVSRTIAAADSTSGTLTEFIVKKEIGKPSVIQSQIVHKTDIVRDKCLATPTSQQMSQENILAKTVVHKNNSASSCIPDPVSAAPAGANSVQESHSSQPVKVLSHKKDIASDSSHRLKERCKRQLEEPDEESVAQFVKRHMAKEKEIQFLEPDFVAHKKTKLLRKTAVKTHLKAEVLRKPSVKTQQTAVSVPAEVVAQGESAQKVSDARSIKTVSNELLPPWTCKRRQSSPRPPTTKKQKFIPQIKVKTQLDSLSVQLKFL